MEAINSIIKTHKEVFSFIDNSVYDDKGYNYNDYLNKYVCHIFKYYIDEKIGYIKIYKNNFMISDYYITDDDNKDNIKYLKEKMKKSKVYEDVFFHFNNTNVKYRKIYFMYDTINFNNYVCSNMLNFLNSINMNQQVTICCKNLIIDFDIDINEIIKYYCFSFFADNIIYKNGKICDISCDNFICKCNSKLNNKIDHLYCKNYIIDNDYNVKHLKYFTLHFNNKIYISTLEDNDKSLLLKEFKMSIEQNFFEN